MPDFTIHTFDLEFQGKPGLIASFLVEGPNGGFLVETGPETCRATLLKCLEAKGFALDQIHAVFVTHIHLDHSGGAGWWAEQGIPVYVHPKGAKHLVDPARLEESARMVYGARFDELWGSLIPAPENQVKTIEHEEVVTIAGIEVQAIETFGHAFHHHAFAVGGSVFTGDAAGARLMGADYISVTAAPPQFHLEHTLASIDRIAERNPESLYLTHFGEVTEVATHLEDYRDAVEMNAQFVSDRMRDGMDEDSLQIAYEAFNLEQAFRLEVSRSDWERYQTINGTAMCADGLRLYWEKIAKET